MRSPLPIPTVLFPEGDSFTAGLRYGCVTPFPIELLDTPGDADKSEDPPAAYIRTSLGGVSTEPADWWLISRSPTEAEYLGRWPQGGFEYAIVTFDAGVWRAVSYGDCRLRAEAGDNRVLSWWIPERRWPEPDDRELLVTVRGECASSLVDRLVKPVIRYSADAIAIILAAVRPDPDWPTCNDPDDQLARAEVQLDEPVGDRSLWDGESWPLRDAHTKTEPLIFCCG